MRRLALAFLATLTACAQNPATGGAMFSLVSKQQEVAIGEETATHYLKLYGQYQPSSRQTHYVKNLCDSIFAVTEAAADPLQCIVLDSSTYNAWATPGYINVYRGLLPYVSTEAELAAVIAHESGHINARHIAQAQTRSMLLGGALAGGLIYAGSQGASAGTTQAISDLGSQAVQVANSTYGRGDEREADALAQRYMPRAGYDPREEVNMIRAMQLFENYQTQLAIAFNGGKPPKGPALGTLTASHPPTPERYSNVVGATGTPDGSVKLPAGVTPATPAADPQGRARYLQAMDGLVFGPQRRFGIGGHGYIAFPANRIVLNLPDGFVLDYEENEQTDAIGTWKGAHPQSGVTFRVAVIKAPAGTNPAGFVQKNLGFEIKDFQRLPINGEKGDNASATAYTGTFNETFGSLAYRIVAIPLPAQTDPRRDAIMVVGFTFPDKATREAEQSALLAALEKSRYLSAEAARKWQPLKLHAFTAAAGDTVSRRAQKLPTGAMAQEWFRALNTLEPGEDLKPGTMYKTVEDPNLPLL
ncbi:MAG: M48 family metalloprotease [Proteobacteria bacterium]|nr:M48 family metalloprotease [Pseudomonadota bacterium]